MGPSYRVVRKLKSFPGIPERSKCGDRSFSASLEKSESFTSSSEGIWIFVCSRQQIVLERPAHGHGGFRLRNSFEGYAEPRPFMFLNDHLYGFPTALSATLVCCPTLGRCARRRSHSVPRPREAIPKQFSEPLDVDASVWPGCNLQLQNSNCFKGASMACAGRVLVWWDRDFDAGGRPIRSDVRAAGRELWEQACQQTIAAVDECGPAAELMEYAVAQVSRYLDRIGAPLNSRKHGLLMVAFYRALGRYRAKLARLELVGGSEELAERASSKGWVDQTNVRLELESVVRLLSARNAQVLMLRAAGYEWKEIAGTFGTSVARVRSGFWREIDRLRWNSAKTHA